MSELLKKAKSQIQEQVNTDLKKLMKHLGCMYLDHGEVSVQEAVVCALDCNCNCLHSVNKKLQEEAKVDVSGINKVEERK